MPLKLNRLLRLAALLVLAVVVVAVTGTAAHAQGVDQSLPPAADLVISVEPRVSTTPSWNVSVQANRVGRYPMAAVHNVKVRVSAELVRPHGQNSAINPGDLNLPEMWVIPSLTLNDAIHTTDVAITSLEYTQELIRVTFEIIGSDPAEPPGFQANNTSEFWYNRHNHSNGDTGVNIIGISDRSPEPEGTTTFTVRAENYIRSSRRPFTNRFRSRDFDNRQFDVQVRIELSPGLTFAGAQAAPGGTAFSATTGIWDIGTLADGSADAKSFPVAVNLTNDSLAELPLEKRCFTAKLVSAVPWFEFDPWKRQNDVTTACLGERAIEGFLVNGPEDIRLVSMVDCVGITAYPCTSADTVELIVKITSGTVAGRGQENWVRQVTRGRELASSHLRPEQIIVQVQPSSGRYDGKWRTGRTNLHSVGTTEGVPVLIRYVTGSAWTQITRAVSDVSPKQRPGSFSIKGGSRATFDMLDADTNPTRTPSNLSASFRSQSYPIYLEFGALGTYKIKLTFGGTKSGTAYTASGTYTFYVGPVVELEVRDAGASTALTDDRQAYTVMALNNGPDAAPSVRVTGLPTGVTEFVVSEGEYDPDSGVWTIGELSVGDYRSSGRAYEGPTLTLITEDASAPDITAAIANTRDYSVCIDSDGDDVDAASESACTATSGNTWHSTEYYDHISYNNTATITARAGIAAGHPDAPAGVTVMETPVLNILMWEPVKRVNRYGVSHYEVQRSASPWETLPKFVKEPMYVDMDVRPGQLTPYRVRAVNIFGVPGPWSLPTLILPDAPGGFTAAQLSDGVVELTWTKPDGNGAEITGYNIEVSTDGGGSWADAGASLGGGDTAWVHRDASLGAGRLYRIRAVTSRGPGPWAQAASAVVSAPSLTALAQGPNEIWLSWTMPGGDDALVREYQLEHSTDGRSFRPLATFPAGGDMFYLHENLPPNATRHYRVRAGTELGHGPWSEVRSASTGPGAPRNFRAQAGGPGEILLSWQEPSVRDAQLHEYELDQSTDGGATWQHLAVIPAEEGTSYVHGGLPDGETRHYRVRAFSYYGGATVASEWSPTRSATTVAGVPEAPKDLTAEADGENAVKLSWTEPADNGSPITGYRIEHSPDGGATWQALRSRHSGTSYRHGGLLSGTTQHYRVAALNRNGRSEFSSVASALTGGDATTVPGTPTDLRVTAAERDRVSLAWGPPENDGGTRVTGYEYRYAGPCANAPQDVCEGETRTTGGTSATVSGLKTAGTYDFLVRAVNAVGPGEWAGPVRALVQPEARGRVVVTPASLTVNEGGSATYRVRLSASPTWPVQVALFWEGDYSLSDSLAGRQGMILLPSGYALPEDGSWDNWAFPWNVGVPIVVEAMEDDDAEDGTALIGHEVYAVPCDWLDNPEGCIPDPVYDGMSGPSVMVTVRDND